MTHPHLPSDYFPLLLRRIFGVLAVGLACFTCGILGVMAYQEIQAFRTLKQLSPQIIQILNAHEQALQKLTGAPTIQLPTSANPPPAPAPAPGPPPSPK